MKQYRKIRQSFFLLMLLAALSLQMACQDAAAVSEIRNVRSVDAVPEYSGDPYVVVNDNEPEFSEEEITADSFESYSEQDALGRCGAAQASVGKDLMPTEERAVSVR